VKTARQQALEKIHVLNELKGHFDAEFKVLR
jgi:hypothetical protein